MSHRAYFIIVLLYGFEFTFYVVILLVDAIPTRLSLAFESHRFNEYAVGTLDVF